MTDLTKDEIVKMARDAGAIISPQWGVASNIGTATFERFATLCRAPLVAEVERLNADMKQMGTDLSAIQEIHNQQKAKLYAELADWKARALKAEQVGEPALWQYRWTNPSGDPYQEPLTGWKQVEPAWNQTVQQKCDELMAYRFEGKPTYEVRGLYATPPQPAAQVRAEPTHWEVKQGGRVFVLNAQEFTGKSYDLASFKPLYAAPQPAAQESTSAVPVVEQLLSALMYHRDQTRPINTTTEAIAAGQEYLKENGK